MALLKHRQRAARVFHKIYHYSKAKYHRMRRLTWVAKLWHQSYLVLEPWQQFYGHHRAETLPPPLAGLLIKDQSSGPLADFSPKHFRDASLNLYASISDEERLARVAQGYQKAKGPRDLHKKEKIPGLTIVILTLNKPHFIIPLLRYLKKEKKVFEQLGLTLHIVVGDTGSNDLQVLAYYKEAASFATIVLNLAYHFSKNNNFLVQQYVQTSSLLLLNNDVIFPNKSASLLKMYQQLWQDPQTAIVGSCLFYGDQKIQHLGIYFREDEAERGIAYVPFAREDFFIKQYHEAWSVPAVTGACLMMKTQVFEDVGGFDESYAIEFQDIALCLASRRLGVQTKLLYVGPVMHLENGTRPICETLLSDRRHFLRTMGTWVDAVEGIASKKLALQQKSLTDTQTKAF